MFQSIFQQFRGDILITIMCPPTCHGIEMHLPVFFVLFTFLLSLSRSRYMQRFNFCLGYRSLLLSPNKFPVAHIGVIATRTVALLRVPTTPNFNCIGGVTSRARYFHS